jgi:hypothetical protein
MKNQFPAYYRPTPEEFAQSFKEGVFVFDTNVLLNLYRYTPESTEKVIAILKKIKDRIWLPHQVGQEYHKGRINELLNQQGLVDKIETEIGKAIAGIEKLGRSSVLFAANSLIEPVQNQLKALQSELKLKKGKRPDLMYGDSVFNALTELFDGAVGKPFIADEYEAIYKEGKDRYEKQIPPGYKDKSNKPGDNDQFGDLILWKQVIAFAKLDSRPLVFVTDDAKEDWWHEIAGERLGPRVELREEFLSATNGKWFYMYSMEQFLKHAREYLGADVPTEVIEEAEGIEVLDLDRRTRESETEVEASENILLDPRGVPSLMKRVFGASEEDIRVRYESFTNAQRREFLRDIDRVFKTLTYKEREIVKLTTGLGDGYLYTEEECGRIFKLPPSAIRQLANKAIRKLQHPIRSRQLERYL